jgi:hypothetical protein
MFAVTLVILFCALHRTTSDSSMRGWDTDFVVAKNGGCSCSGPPGTVQCSSDLSCFDDPNQPYIAWGPYSNGAQTITVTNCVARHPCDCTEGISSVSAGLCSSSKCTASISKVKMFDTVFEHTFDRHEKCVDINLYFHDDSYKLSAAALSPTQTNCISNDNQRCHLCTKTITVCKNSSPPDPPVNPCTTQKPTVKPTRKPTVRPTIKPTQTPSVRPSQSQASLLRLFLLESQANVLRQFQPNLQLNVQ